MISSEAPALSRVERRQVPDNYYGRRFEVVAVFTDGTERVLFATRSYVECAAWRPGKPRDPMVPPLRYGCPPPSARERCDRCGRDLAGGLPSPCPRCAVRRAELEAELEARTAALDDDVMPCGCCSGSCYCDGEESGA